MAKGRRQREGGSGRSSPERPARWRRKAEALLLCVAASAGRCPSAWPPAPSSLVRPSVRWRGPPSRGGAPLAPSPARGGFGSRGWLEPRGAPLPSEAPRLFPSACDAGLLRKARRGSFVLLCRNVVQEASGKVPSGEVAAGDSFAPEVGKEGLPLGSGWGAD